MKFYFEQEPEKHREPVAYIDKYGDLLVKGRHGQTSICQTDHLGPMVSYLPAQHWRPHDSSNKKVFYPGDRVTIQF